MRAFELDCLENSHPIEVKVGHPSEINQIFDSISYCKGSSIIRMLNNYIGEDFVLGLQSYLKKYQYKNATTENLWDELKKYSNKEIGILMQTWTKESGYPLITVKYY
jgi:puromycin-sensitive aminopeptidase